MIRSRDHLAMVLSFRLRDDSFEACDDFGVMLIQVFADSLIGQQGTRIDGQPEQVDRVLLIQPGVEVVLLLGLAQLLEQVVLTLGRFVPRVALSPLPCRTQGRWRLQYQALGEGYAVVLIALPRRENLLLPGRLDVRQLQSACTRNRSLVESRCNFGGPRAGTLCTDAVRGVGVTPANQRRRVLRVQGSGFGDQLSALSFQPMVACGPDAPIRGPHLNGMARDAPYLASSSYSCRCRIGG